MATYRFSADRQIAAPAQRVYAILADYDVGHQAVLPRPPFVSMIVEQGGRGAGTVILTTMKFLGTTQSFRASIDEPIPGRLLRETSPEKGLVTTFEVEPLGAGICRLTITTEFRVAGGIAGKIQGWLSAKALLPTYRKELGIIAAYAAHD